MAWLLISGAGVVDRIWLDDKKDENDGKGENNLSHVPFCLMAALTLSVAYNRAS